MARRAFRALLAAIALLAVAAPQAVAGPAEPRGITLGSDGAMWFAETARDRIGRIAADGSVTEFPLASVVVH